MPQTSKRHAEFISASCWQSVDSETPCLPAGWSSEWPNRH